MTQLPIENVQDYPRPPALQAVGEKLRIVLGGRVAAETKNAYRVLETHHAPTYYLPPADVHAVVTPAKGRSFCEWKGVASYWDIALGDVAVPRAAWSYANPSGNFVSIAGYLAFYAASMDACFVGEAKVIPQPGDFYGGWVTGNLQGQIKGTPGTEFW